MMKRSVVVYDGELKYLPPIATLVQALHRVGENPVLVCTDHFSNPKYLNQYDFKVEYVSVPLYMDSIRKHPVRRIMNAVLRGKHFIERRKAFWSSIRKVSAVAECNLWTINTPTLDTLGDEVVCYGCKHIHMCYELEDDWLTCRHGFTAAKILNDCTMVQCEPNRADIMAAMYKLRKRPFVLPNRPYRPRSEATLSDVDGNVEKIVSSWGGKFVFFYQGMLGPDRIGLVQVLRWLCEEFPDDIVALQTHIKGFSFDDLFKYDNFCVVPPLVAPNHLLVTAKASVGLAFYVTNDRICSPLNAIYCAPNKIYEYAMFGIPTLGNDVPGLRYTVGYKNAGVCFQKLDKDDVVDAAKKLKTNYALYSQGAKRLYEETDVDQIVTEISRSARSDGQVIHGC